MREIERRGLGQDGEGSNQHINVGRGMDSNHR